MLDLRMEAKKLNAGGKIAGYCADRSLLNLKRIREIFWSGRPDLNRRPPAPKAGVTSPGSPSVSISVLKTNELEKYLVVARCTQMWLRMHGVPRIFPIAK